jgi:hypothetical protein
MAALPDGLTQADLDRYAQLDAGIAALAEEHKILNAKIKKAHLDAGLSGKKTLVYPSDKYGAIIVKLNEQRRLDMEALAEKYVEEQFPQYFIHSLDTKAIPADELDVFRTKVVQTLSIDRENAEPAVSPKRVQV